MSSGRAFDLRALALRGLRWHRRSYLASVAMIAVATAVVTGALLVGDSVRGSLRDRALERFGAVDFALSSRTGFFREELLRDESSQARSPDRGDEDGARDESSIRATSVILLRGSAVHAESRQRSARVHIIGVDSTFWSFWEETESLAEPFRGEEGRRWCWVNPALAAAIGSEATDTLLLSLGKAESVASEHLLGARDDAVRTLRVACRRVIPAAGPAYFRLDQGQDDPHVVYVPLSFLQRTLEREGEANVALIAAGGPQDEASSALRARIRERLQVGDLGLAVRSVAARGDPASPESARSELVLESRELVLPDAVVESAEQTARALGATTRRVLTYLANTVRVGEREIPYSTITAVEDGGSAERLFAEAVSGPLAGESIVLNDWAARELDAKVGESVTLRYFVVVAGNELREAEATFQLAGIVPIDEGPFDASWTPTFPGISDSASLRDWDPPFPVDFDRIEDRDEEYWDEYRATPKGAIALAEGIELWATRFGRATSVRVDPAETGLSAETFASALLDRLDPGAAGLSLDAVKARALTAARGATDFAMLFVAFSFFLIVSALVLLSLVFRLAAELRARELGTLLATGFTARDATTLLLREGRGLVVIGAIVGAVGGVGYAAALVAGLRTLWSGAVSAPFLELHVTAGSIAIGLSVTAILAFAVIIVVARRITRTAPRALLAGVTRDDPVLRRTSTRSRGFVVVAGGVACAVLTLVGTLDAWAPEACFFGAGAAGLVAGLAALDVALRKLAPQGFAGRGVRALIVLGVRNAGRRPARSLLTASVLAVAAFIVIAVAAQRRDVRHDDPQRDSGDGGYSLVARSAVPLTRSLGSRDGREALNLVGAADALVGAAEIHALRVKPGDDSSCLNLYRPQSPRIVGVESSFRAAGGFRWAKTLADSAEERANPWLLLERTLPDGAIPAIADLNTAQWILHVGLGDEIEVLAEDARPVKIRLVGLLAHSIFQSELVIASETFVRAFPRETGWSQFLFRTDVPNGPAPVDLSGALESALADYGFDVRTTGEVLAAFKRVENTYLSTFQILGGLGLLLGTLGLAVVLVRNVNERRAEIGLLRAVGYTPAAVRWVVFSETGTLLAGGLVVGGGAALLASVPVFLSGAGEVSVSGVLGTVAVIAAAGLGAAALSMQRALASSSPVDALRGESRPR